MPKYTCCDNVDDEAVPCPTCKKIMVEPIPDPTSDEVTDTISDDAPEYTEEGDCNSDPAETTGAADPTE